jgi:hypothetical protein
VRVPRRRPVHVPVGPPAGFYGRHVVGWSVLMTGMTAPGQTAAVSVFIDPMLDELGIGRSAISTAYLAGTLTGALATPTVGRLLDRFGVRRVMVVIGLVFAAALCALSAVGSIVGLTAGFVLIRMAGQGALGVTATTAVALWFTRRRGTAMGLVSGVGDLARAGAARTPRVRLGLAPRVAHRGHRGRRDRAARGVVRHAGPAGRPRRAARRTVGHAQVGGAAHTVLLDDHRGHRRRGTAGHRGQTSTRSACSASAACPPRRLPRTSSGRRMGRYAASRHR